MREDTTTLGRWRSKERKRVPLCSPQFLQLPDHRTSPEGNPTHESTNLPMADSLTPRSPDEFLIQPFKDIYTATPTEEFLAELLKNFPPQNCWELWQDLISRWGKSTEEKDADRDNNKSFEPQLLVWGVPGTGKTSTINAVAELIDGEPPLCFNAGDRSLNELLVETKLTKDHENIPKLLEEAFQKGKLNSNSVDLLRQANPAAFQTDQNGREHLNLTDPNRFSLGLEKNLAALTTVAKLEGFISAGSSLGVRYMPGLLIHACKTGQKLLVDEIDKAGEGSNKLSQVWLVLQGQLDQFHFKEGDIEFTFQRKGKNKTIHPDFDIIYTANDLSNGTSTSWAGQHLLQRVHPVQIKPNGTAEIATRIEQTLLGFNPQPIIVSQNIKNPTQTIQAIFKRAGQNLTDIQIKLVERLPKVRQAAKQLAAVFSSWDSITKTREMDDEILSASRNVVARDINVRYAQLVITEALAYKDEVLGNPKEATPVDTPTLEDALAYLDNIFAQAEKNPQETKIRETGVGEAIRIVIQKRLTNFGCDGKTQNMLLQAARIGAVIPPEQSEEGNGNAQLQLVEKLLNTLEDEIKIEAQTYELRDAYANLLKKQHPQLQGKDNEQIIPAKILQNCINKALELSRSPGGATYTVGLNPSYLASASGDPITLIPLLDQRDDKDRLLNIKKQALAAGHKDLAPLLTPTSEIEAALKNPTLRKICVKNLWNLAQNLCSQTPSPAGEMNEYDLDAIQRGNPRLQTARLLGSKQNPKNPKETDYSPILIIQSEEKGAFIAYSKDFSQTLQQGNVAVTNDATTAAKTLLKAIKGQSEDILWARKATQYLSTPHPYRTWNPKGGYKETPKEEAEALADKLAEAPPNATEEEIEKEIADNLKKGWELPFNAAISPSKIFSSQPTKNKKNPTTPAEIQQ